MLEYFDYSFFRQAIAGVALISLCAAIIGTYIISRRMVAISGGITHACFGGLGLGYFLGMSPVLMAAVFAVGSALGVDWLSRRFRVREDSAIAVVWALGMALGVLFVFLTPGYVPELNSFLFGNILTVSTADLWSFAGFALVLAAFFAWQYRNIVATALRPRFRRRHRPARAHDFHRHDRAHRRVHSAHDPSCRHNAAHVHALAADHHRRGLLPPFRHGHGRFGRHFINLLACRAFPVHSHRRALLRTHRPNDGGGLHRRKGDSGFQVNCFMAATTARQP